MDTDLYYKLRNNIYADFNNMNVNDIGAMEFAGGYPGNLTEEINNYSIIAGVVARTLDYDIIHAHDWLTFPAGIYAKKYQVNLCAFISMQQTLIGRAERLILLFMVSRRMVWTMLIASCVCQNLHGRPLSISTIRTHAKCLRFIMPFTLCHRR